LKPRPSALVSLFVIWAASGVGREYLGLGGVSLGQQQSTATFEIARIGKDVQGWILSVRRTIEEGLSPEERDLFRKELFPEQELKICNSGLSNVVVIAPHGFPGDDDHTDYLAYFLAKELKASYLINNKAFYKPARHHCVGQPADLNRPWSPNSHTKRFMGILLEMVRAVQARCQAIPLVLCIHGMSDANARKLRAGDFCLGAGYTSEERDTALDPQGWATASREVIDGVLRGLNQRGFVATDGVPQYCAKKAIPGYLKSMEEIIGPTQAIQVEVRYLGLRDPANLVRTARELAAVVRGLKEFKTLE
jgi:hypothetical protein